MSAWHDYTTAALLGTEKATSPPLPAALEATISAAATMDREVGFLTRAGALALWRRAGVLLPAIEASISPAPMEETSPVSRVSAAHLRMMLGGRGLAVLPEWLREVARLGRHTPPEMLPALLDRARQDRALRPLAFAAGGQRVQWLATHHQDWAFATADSPELWETGNRDQRVAILRALRLAAPVEARVKVEEVWKAEPAELRAAFVAELATHLSSDDTPFLEAALDDRSKEVRRAAIDLLTRLSSSPLVARMTARAASLLSFKRGGLLSRAALDVTLPADPDADATRDGLDPKAFGNQKTLGEKAVLLVLILSAVPLRHWTETFQTKPEAILKAAGKSEFASALATGWAWAALRQRDVVWAEALLDSAVPPHLELLPGETLLTILPETARADRLAGILRAGALKKGDTAAWQMLAAQLGTFPGHWPEPLAREVLSALRLATTAGIPWHLRAVAESLVIRLPPALLAEAAYGWPIDQEGIAGLVELIAFRHDALNALNQP